MSALAAHLLTWARLGFGLVVPTGFMMFAAHATEFASNPAFRLKLVLIAAAVINAGAFHQWPFKSVGRWDVAAATPALRPAGMPTFSGRRSVISSAGTVGTPPPLPTIIS